METKYSPSMGGTITNFSHLNNSKSKQRFVFGTEPRFERARRQFPGKIAYDVKDSQLSPICNSFGKERRFIMPKSQAPDPGIYKLPSEFDSKGWDMSKTLRKSGKYFGAPRQKRKEFDSG